MEITLDNQDNSSSGTQDDDVIFSLDGDDVIFGLGGIDVIDGGPGDDQLFSGSNGTAAMINEILSGREGDDLLDGGTGDDNLTGEEGNDTLIGGSDNDFLDGGTGDDVLRGGSGTDTFRFDDDSGGFDTIEDFRRGEDVLELDISRATFQRAFGNTVNAADRGVDALDPDDGRGTQGGELVIDFSDPGIPGGAPGDSVLTLVGVNQLSIHDFMFV